MKELVFGVCLGLGISLGISVGAAGIAVGGTAYAISGWLWGSAIGVSSGAFLNLFF